MNKEIYRNLSDYFPFVARRAVKYKERGDWELIVRLDDGSMMSYDDYNKSIRVLPDDREHMSEDEFRREFGIRLRKFLEQRHISQSKLSDMTGLSMITISKYVNGTRTPSWFTVDKIARALGCSVEEFRY